MPMRGTLPLTQRREVTRFEDELLTVVSSSDFAAVSAFATCGIVVSLYVAFHYPEALATVIATIAQSL
jgi:hypothetical protein